METLTAKKYNEQQTLKWHKNYDRTLKQIKEGSKSFGELPQLAMYIFNKNYGYVAHEGNTAIWDRLKSGAQDKLRIHIKKFRTA